MITQERLKQLLHYNPDTGVFTWMRSPARCIKAGDVAGGVNKATGYIVIRLDGKLYPSHRLAFLDQTGEFPPADVDHKNGVRSDNRWVNLRPATRFENHGNCGARQGSGSGIKGVSWHRKAKKWQARIQVHGRTYYLGLFGTTEEANDCYQGAASLIFGEFAHHRNQGDSN